MPVAEAYRAAPRYLDLGPGFADEVPAARFPEAVLRFRNQPWAERVGLGPLSHAEWKNAFWAFHALPNNLPEPLATRYHGHQFRTYNPNIGDGRGFLFAQLRDDRGRLLDLGTKGSGRTPHSRGGDGRLTLKGAVREILATELLEARGVPTSKTFSVFETGEALQRSDEPSPTRSAVLVRLSHSHIRFGTFQRHAHHNDTARVRALVEHSVEHYYPELANEADVPFAFFRGVLPNAVRMVAAWMAAGFVHGVLNTDNMNITGESFDYGPWRFLARYDPTFIAAYFDGTGLYAYGRQVEAVGWNLARLAEALKPLSPSAPWQDAVNEYEALARRAVPRHFLRRLGLAAADDDTNATTLEACLAYLGETPVPFSQFIHDLYGKRSFCESPFASQYTGARFAAVQAAFDHHEVGAQADLNHPHLTRPYPVDLRIEEVEELWARIDFYDDWAPLAWKIEDIRASAPPAALSSRE
ncbi:MAG: YdiU family protein [Myxococcota bacterium]